MPRAAPVGKPDEPLIPSASVRAFPEHCPWLLQRQRALAVACVLLIVVVVAATLAAEHSADHSPLPPSAKPHNRPVPMPPSPPPAACSGHGQLVNGTCRCEGLWGGTRCATQLSPYFPGSQLIASAAVGLQLNRWMDGPSGHQYHWKLCFSSFVHPADDASVYHAQCDEYQLTLTVARNALGFTFGGLARGSFGYAQCCKVDGNSCAVPNVCFCQQSCAADYIFKLSPGEMTKYPTTGTNDDYQDAEPKHWPCWGTGDDLLIGRAGPPGQGAKCKQGHTYAGNESEACGGGIGTWGHTDVEVWRMD